MNIGSIIAQANSTANGSEEAVIPLDVIWEYIISINFLEAVTFISFGAVCLLYGWRVFKVLVVICFGLLGLAGGVVMAEKLSGPSAKIFGGLIGMGLFIGVSIPLMRWAVSILGAAAGGVLTAGLWYALGLTEQYIWAGALVGIVAGGMISFIIFKIAVMLFSSLGGATLITTGVLALLYIYPETTEYVRDMVYNQKWFLPVALFVPTMIGLFLQNKFVKKTKDWSL